MPIILAVTQKCAPRFRSGQGGRGGRTEEPVLDGRLRRSGKGGLNGDFRVPGCHATGAGLRVRARRLLAGLVLLGVSRGSASRAASLWRLHGSRVAQLLRAGAIPAPVPGPATAAAASAVAKLGGSGAEIQFAPIN